MIRVLGKLVGAGVGFALASNPVGAILGIIVGHAVDQRMAEVAARRKNPIGNDTTSHRQAIYASGTVVLGAKLSKVSGQVTRTKIDAFKRIFKVQKADEVRIGKMFDHARRSAEGFEPHAFSLAQAYVSQPAVLEEILCGLMQVAAADGPMGVAEADFLRSIAFTFNFSPDDFQRLVARAGVRIPSAEKTREARREIRRDSAIDPYAVLELNDKASNDDVKNAYRNLIRKHHPDRLTAEGASAELIAIATEKMKRINIAYDTVCKMREIK